jgi:glycolate oxidase
MLSQAQIDHLTAIVGQGSVLSSKEDLLAYSYDGTTLWAHLPDCVVLPQNVEQISKILSFASANLIAVTPRGGGTNVSGGSIPVKGGIVLCTTRMNRILKIDKENLVAEVEAGVVLQDLNQALAKDQLFYPPDPQSSAGCTLGGTIAENAGGPYGAKYGVTKHYLLGLKVVLASGETANLGGRTIKNRMGYELSTLFAGSEGTLGIIAEITLKLIPAPKSQRTVLAIFAKLETAGQAVSNIVAAGLVPAKVEIMDNWFLRRIEGQSHLGLPVEADAMLLIQSDGDPRAVENEVEQIIRACQRTGAREARSAVDEAEAFRMWQARRGCYGAVTGSSPTVLTEDVTVPRDKIAPLIRRCQEISRKYEVVIPITGHAGDGNIHPAFLTDANDKQHFSRTMQAIDEMINAALELGGVISGEHGIGLEKQQYFSRFADPVALKIMKGIKGVLDPQNILNPGKYWEG